MTAWECGNSQILEADKPKPIFDFNFMTYQLFDFGQITCPSVFSYVCLPVEGLNVTVGDPPIDVNFLPALVSEVGYQFDLDKDND